MVRNPLFKHIDEMVPWNAREHMLECVAWTPEAPDVMTFTFRAEHEHIWFRYLPGQYITLELPVGPEPLLRTYTISSSPSRPFTIAVTVKAQKDSIGTRWMFENLHPGMKIRAIGPLGDFSYVKHPADKYLFISAGSGITPMMAMTRDLGDRDPDTDIAFIHCARSPNDIIFRWELEYKARYMPFFNLGFIVSELERTQLWSGLKGFIDRAKIGLLVPDFLERQVFCCGPEPFMATVRESLISSSFDMENQYFEETFTPELPPPTVGVGDSGEAEKLFTIAFAEAGVRVEAEPGFTILQMARSAGVRIPAACESGICGTCRVKCRSGKVDMQHNGGILDDEMDDGYILACCSRPLSDVEVEA
ncbi:hybrid-cluster NAD(P)-dependent oxidoreductase [Martelella mediterranea]|uniref:Ferredoxin-NADP reductase n=1 Tax=Martelella mediterranea TaxID=293089 RepID=A0A4R3NWR0_9HYPH|nr:hybrid-cluster NAD(P)-dependent oxidoreductase [Martelella mediterranea]TCT45039.1 ferredoxin-NADP reductase [Martelella mediterranea]